jgi:hypothetical protein
MLTIYDKTPIYVYAHVTILHTAPPFFLDEDISADLFACLSIDAIHQTQIYTHNTTPMTNKKPIPQYNNLTKTHKTNTKV